MQEDFNSDVGFVKIRSAAKCPFASGTIRPYHNKRAYAAFEPSTFGTPQGAGVTAGSSFNDHDAAGTLGERSIISFKTGYRGTQEAMDNPTNTFQNIKNSDYYSNAFSGGMSTASRPTQDPLWSRPRNNTNASGYYNSSEPFIVGFS